MSQITRRDAIASTLAMVGGLTAISPPHLPSLPAEWLDTVPRGDQHDWDWLVGKWNVRHSRLKERLMNDTRWEEFRGTCQMWSTMEGKGNVDDNYLELPSGTYRAMGLRALDEKTGLWSMWWVDGRTTVMDPPVRGGFKDGIGTFVGEDTLRGKPILMRFEWSKITKASAHWEQAFSPDKGKTWEVNWRMDFTRG
jgi:hypothetical protein